MKSATVDLFPTPEQALLVEAAAGFVRRAVDTEAVRTLEASEAGYDPEHWATMTSLGWTELPPLELALVVEQLGRVALPSPLPVSAALRNAVPGYLDGTPAEVVTTLAAVVPGAVDATGPHPESRAGTLTGTFLLVPYGPQAGVLLVATADGIGAVDPTHPGIGWRRHDAVSGDALWRLDLDGVPVTPTGGGLRTVLDHLAITALAATVGAAEAALELSVTHARTREQFGQPIGAFQAVAHRCADMRAEVDACRYLAYRAAWALSAAHSDVDARAAVDSALSYATDALRRVAMHAHQVHGAIGFSTEHDLHLFTRRIKAFELSHGSTAAHQERFARCLGLRW